MSEPNLDPSQQLLIRPTLTSTPVNSTILKLCALHSASETTLRRKNLRHLSQLKNASTRKCLELFFKYKARCISELYDKCTSDEYCQLISLADIQIHRHLNIAKELYVKDLLDVQRADRWMWFAKSAIDFKMAEVCELRKIFEVNQVNIEHFSNDIYRLMNHLHEKKYALRLWGPPDSCKSIIARGIVASFICAYFNNHNSENEFWLAAALAKAFLLFEEVLLTQATCEDFKTIWQGLLLDLSKKYNDKQILIDTPSIITMNFNDFGRGHLNPLDEKALKKRVFDHHFPTPYMPKVHISPPSVAYLIYRSCTINDVAI